MANLNNLNEEIKEYKERIAKMEKLYKELESIIGEKAAESSRIGLEIKDYIDQEESSLAYSLLYKEKLLDKIALKD